MFNTPSFQWSALLKQPSYHFLLLWCLVLMHMFNWAEPYRVFLYLNLLAVLIYSWDHLKNEEKSNFRKLIFIFSIPLGFMILHMFAVGRIEFIKEMRLIMVATFLMLGVWVLAKRDLAYVKRHVLFSTVALLVIYSVVQAIALVLFQRPYGTTKNPHYLAQYSALAIPIAIFSYFYAPARVKALLVFLILVLGSFVLYTSSRPVWIALIVSALFVLIFLHGRKRIIAAGLVILIPCILFFANVDNFGERFTDLAENISKEERVIIWEDAWTMQKNSGVGQWLYGHGLDSFLEDFKPYSRFHSIADFNAPHNYFLEILYTSGILGLILFVALYYSLVSQLIKTARFDHKNKNFIYLLMVLLIIHSLFIAITIPFFSSYNMNILALIGGSLLFVREMTGAKK